MQGNISIALAQLAYRDRPLGGRQIRGDVDHRKSKKCQLGHPNLDLKGVVPDRVECVLGAHLGLGPDRI